MRGQAPLGAFNGPGEQRGQWVQPMALTGHLWLSLVTGTPRSLPQGSLLGKEEVLLHVRSVVGPEGLYSFCLFAFAACFCVCV